MEPDDPDLFDDVELMDIDAAFDAIDDGDYPGQEGEE